MQASACSKRKNDETIRIDSRTDKRKRMIAVSSGRSFLFRCGMALVEILVFFVGILRKTPKNFLNRHKFHTFVRITTKR